jgi:hypothetical protein
MGETITVTYSDNLSDIRRELARIPEITEAEAGRMVADMNRATRAAERAAKSAPMTVRPALPMLSALALTGLR